MTKTKIDFTAPPTTYQEHLNSIDKSEAASEYVVRHKRMYLDEQPFFSKNQIDAAVSRASAKHGGYILLAFLLGLSVSIIYILLHTKMIL